MAWRCWNYSEDFMRRLGAFIILLAGSVSAQTRSLRVDHRIFPGLHEMDGNWAALFSASDGKVYAGLAYHGSDGHMVYYLDPA
jgi:hypothetical protein